MSLGFPKPEAWVDEAACNPRTADDFYGGPDDAERRGRPSKSVNATIEHAKGICTRCEVRPECLGAAIKNEERWGIWGGLDFGRDRDELVRRMA